MRGNNWDTNWEDRTVHKMEFQLGHKQVSQRVSWTVQNKVGMKEMTLVATREIPKESGMANMSVRCLEPEKAETRESRKVKTLVDKKG